MCELNSEDALRATSERFYAAVQDVLQGDVASMLAIWAQSDQASYCDPRGEIVVGWHALEAYWRQAASSDATSPVKLTVSGGIEHAVVTSDLAYVVALEEVCQVGASSVMRARATHVYRCEARADGGWRLLHRHADAKPAVSEQT
jgi:ketosteroid isomerase-like protein